MPSIEQPTTPMLPLADEGRGSLEYWRGQLQAAEDKRKDYKDQEWDPNVQAYLGKTTAINDGIVVPKDFANVERKKAELFFQNPDVNLTPKMPGLEDAVSTFQGVLNYYLGPDGVDAGTMMLEATFDLHMTGLMISKIGYENFAGPDLPVETGMMGAPSTPEQPGNILNLNSPAPMPMEAPAPNIVFERYFWERVSPAKVLIPADFTGSNYDRAAWLAYEFTEDWELIKQRYKLPEELELPRGHRDDDQKLKGERQGNSDSPTDRVRGWEIWYKASLFDASVPHPEQQHYLVLIEGIEEPVSHKPSPYQRMMPDGKLGGMRGFPIHVGAIRYVSDSAIPTTETTVTRSQINELNKSRTQMILQRDRNAPMRMGDVQRLGGEPGMEKIRKNVWQAVIPVTGLDANNPPILEVARASYPPEDFTFNQIINRDIEEAWAFGANQLAQPTNERKTATEIRTIQSNVSARLDYERRQVIKYYVRGAEKLGALIQMFAGAQQYVQIVGQDGERRLQPWNKEAIQGEFVYDARPDSAVRLDAAQEFKDLVELYNMTAKDPHANRVELLTRMGRLKNLDPARWVVPKLPERKPEPPKAAFAFKGEDLIPSNPHFPIIIEILTQAGYKISTEALTLAVAQTEAQAAIMGLVQATAPGAAEVSGKGEAGVDVSHGGTAPTADRVSKHQSERTGQMSGPSTET